MADYKFWRTQPVPQFHEAGPAHSDENGPIVDIDSAKISREPIPLIEGYVWADLDLKSDSHLKELCGFLKGHYMSGEDEDDLFFSRYSSKLLQWCVAQFQRNDMCAELWRRKLQPPGWKSKWHIGIRESRTSRLVASITAVPMTVRVHGREFKMPFVDLLCVHKELRSKRLAPVLVQEMARRCSLDDFHHAIYTSVSVLPKPISVAREYHRMLNPAKMIEIESMSVQACISINRKTGKYALPEETSTPGLRPMVDADVPSVHILLQRYLERFDVAPVLSEDEVRHLLMFETNIDEVPVVCTYVVEDAVSHAITDVVSFFTVSNTVLKSTKHKTYVAAYSSYYASAAAWEEGGNLKERLVTLQRDALILASKVRVRGSYNQRIL